MRNYPRFLRRDTIDFGDGLVKHYGWDILWFRTWHFFFRWFTDCGEWFICLEWHWKNKCWYLRFSSAGFLKGYYEHNEQIPF